MSVRLGDLRVAAKLAVISALMVLMASVLVATAILAAGQLSRGQQLMYERNVSAAVELSTTD